MLDVNYAITGSEEPWEVLAKLTSLQQLSLRLNASGDPSSLSALTGLSCLSLQSFALGADGPAPFSFSSLQPLSTLQQLEVLHLGYYASAATSLQGLAGLSNLKRLELDNTHAHSSLISLEGISPGVTGLFLTNAPKCVALAGIESCSRMEKLTLDRCGVSSLRSLRGFSSLKEVLVSCCPLASLDGLNSRSLQSLSLLSCGSLLHLSGIGHLSDLKRLTIDYCGMTSLQPLSQLGEGLQQLVVWQCNRVQEEILELPHVQPAASVFVRHSNVKEVVVAGGVRLACSR
jgi:Leucine-rich repeat (LRR) protein